MLYFYLVLINCLQLEVSRVFMSGTFWETWLLKKDKLMLRDSLLRLPKFPRKRNLLSLLWLIVKSLRSWKWSFQMKILSKNNNLILKDRGSLLANLLVNISNKNNYLLSKTSSKDNRNNIILSKNLNSLFLNCLFLNSKENKNSLLLRVIWMRD